MTHQDLLVNNEYLKAFEAEKAAEAEQYKQVQEAAKAWREKWPNHCKSCHGWGGETFRQSHPYGMGSAEEILTDPCEATEKPETCHRCGLDGLDQDSNGPCSKCGWDHNDGEPQW